MLRCTLLLLLSLPSLAMGADRSAREIWEEAQRLNRVENAVQKVRMVLVARNGSERVREMEIRVRRDGEITRSYTRFDSPSDVAGTQLVLVDEPGREDEQLMYMPALERVNRIAGGARSRSFLGSDFRFEDFELDTGTGEHKLVDETDEHWLIESTGTSTSWELIRSWISRADNLPRKVLYLKKGEVAREMVVEQVEQRGSRPIPIRTIMRDVKRGSATRLEVVDVRLDVPADELLDEMFTAAWLEQNG